MLMFGRIAKIEARTMRLHMPTLLFCTSIFFYLDCEHWLDVCWAP